MPTFTMPLKDVLEIYPDIGLSSYPIFDETYREALNQKIIDHFWNREIGQEDASLFRFALKRKMNEIMPLYNLYYKSNQLQFDPLQTVNVKTFTVKEDNSLLTGETTVAATGSTDTTSDSTGSSHADTTSTVGSDSLVTESSTPQTMLSGSEDYATAAAKTHATTTNTTGTDESTTSNDIQSTTGKNDSLENSSARVETDGTVTDEKIGFESTPIELLIKYRESFINVDMMIIEKLENLFMLVWDNGDSFTERPRRNGFYTY